MTFSRRQFSKLAAASAIETAVRAQTAALTARQVVERIKQNLGIPWNDSTYRDTFKVGNPDVRVAGITTTFMSNLDLLQRSLAAGNNMVVTHEPTFWSDRDTTKELEDDPLYKFKVNFVEKNNMVVWRFHDHWHARKPDGIFAGWNRLTGWDKYLVAEDTRMWVVPEMTFEQVARDLQRRLKTRSMRLIGDPQMKVTKIGRGGHALAQNMAVMPKVDVVLVSEAREWETAEYFRDTVASGQKKGLILIAHEEGEETGMDECAVWMRRFVTEVPVKFIPSGEPFWKPA